MMNYVILNVLVLLIFNLKPINSLYPIKSIKRSSIIMSTTTQSTQSLTFTKYHGLGNDFILIDNTKSSQPLLTPEQSIKICNRNFGIGADGVIFALPGQNGCDFTMRIYNSDGSEPQMCGNGIRCMAKFLQLIEKKQLNEGNEIVYRIWTNAGVIIPTVTSNGLVTVDMGKPILDSVKVPTLLRPTKENVAIESSFDALGYTFKATCVSMGNPHAIIYVDNIHNFTPPFEVIGPAIEKHPMFPERVNVEFVEVLSKDHVRLKVWERGAGPTLACGTGACATVVAGVLTGRNDRSCKVTLPGGDLDIVWNEKDGKIYMTGPAELVFTGSLDKIT